MRKPTFCKWDNKGADQLCSNCEPDQRLCFRYADSTIPLLAFCFDYTGWFVSDLVKISEEHFSHDAAHSFVLKTVKFFHVSKQTVFFLS